MKYYILTHDCDYECLADTNIPDEYHEISLAFGVPVKSLPDIELVVENDKLPDMIPNHQLYLFFNKKIRDIIAGYGVNYIQYFDVQVYDSRNQLISIEYKTANVLKVIDAIDKGKSKLEICEDDGDILDITELHLDYEKTKGEIMFRLEGFQVLLAVREDLAQALVNARCTGLEFYPAEGFSV